MKLRPTIELICAFTGEKFLKDRREYNRQIKNGKTTFYKNREIAKLAIKILKRLSRKPIEIRNCKQCKKPFETKALKRASNFCSHSCCSTWKWIQFKSNSKYQTFIKNKRNYIYGKSTKLASILDLNRCVICDKPFVCKHKADRKTCSKKCYKGLISLNTTKNPNCGGETNYRRYRYNDITFDSSWEVDIAKWLDEQKIEWKRSRKIMFWWIDNLDRKRRYYPDFYLPLFNLYLDPKNKYLIEKDRFKIESVIKENNIKILWGLKDYILNELSKLVERVGF